MGRGARFCDHARMRFDENPPSPDRLVDMRKPDTKNNLMMALGVIVFLLIGGGLLWWFALQGD